MDNEILRPDDAGYDDARSTFNLTADLRPWGVTVPTTVAAVQAAVRFAAAEGLTVAAYATGHLAGALPDLSRTLLVRPRLAEDVEIDAQERTARIPAGRTWDPVVAAAAEHGLIAAHGSSPTVAPVGYLLAGGASFYGRKFGVASNHVRAIELVDAGGALQRVDADTDPDLFWALRGGGGAFGVVTAIEIDLFEATTVYAGTLFYAADDARPVMQAWRAFCETAPSEVSTSFRILTLPPLPEVPEPLRATPHAAIDLVALLDADVGAELIAPLRGAAPLVIDNVAEIPAAAAARVHGDPEVPVPALSATGMVDHLDDAGVDAFLQASIGSGLLAAELRQLGGALAVAPDGAGALAELGDGFLLFAVGVPMGPLSPEAVRAGCDRLREAMEPWLGERDYLGFAEQGGSAERCFAPDVYARLCAIRERVDPQRRFVAPHRIG
jgi:FAD/FMN-containing dehydrogenase